MSGRFIEVRHVMDVGGSVWSATAYEDEPGEYYAIIRNPVGERSDDYQLWIAPYKSTHATAQEALDEAARAIAWGLDRTSGLKSDSRER